jgi:hypothetical protein
MCHKAKIDWFALAGAALTIGALLLRASLWIAGPVLLILMLCAYPQSYETTPHALTVRDAVTRRVIPYEAITSAAPAHWGKRIHIRYGESHLAISPADAAAFLSDIQARAPHLVRRGDALVPRDRYAVYSLDRGAETFRIGMGQS